MDFTGKIVLVTGTTGIAAATAHHFATHGARIVALGIDPSGNEALAQARPRIDVRHCDVGNPAEVAQALESAEALADGLDIIVNAAAVHPYGEVTETAPEAFMDCLRINVGSIHATAHFGVPLMRRRGGGVIVNISSVQGHRSGPRVAAYVASKGAIHALTRSMAVDLGKYGIRVVSVSPGSVRTRILELAAGEDGAQSPEEVEAAFARYAATVPSGTIGAPDEIAAFIAMLASDRFGFVTGSDHVIDGGLSAQLGATSPPETQEK